MPEAGEDPLRLPALVEGVGQAEVHLRGGARTHRGRGKEGVQWCRNDKCTGAEEDVTVDHPTALIIPS